MNRSTIAIIGLALCANVSLAHAAQKCPANIIQTTPAADFEINNDGTVVHNTTGLMWKRCSEGLSGDDCKTGAATAFTWAGALNHVDDLNNKGGFAGHKDWRLPNIKELDSIVDRSCNGPAINTAVFPNIASDYYWSASPFAIGNNDAWVVDFSYGYGNSNDKSNTNRVRLVRSK